MISIRQCVCMFLRVKERIFREARCLLRSTLSCMFENNNNALIVQGPFSEMSNFRAKKAGLAMHIQIKLEEVRNMYTEI